MKKIMFVCMANTCRSPALMATLNHLIAEQNIDAHADSSGIGWAHLGQRPSLKMFEAAKKRGILIDHRSEQFQDAFFEEYDLILAVDEEILEQLKFRGAPYQHKLHLVTDFSKNYKGRSLPDPYYLSESGFDEVLDIIEECVRGLIQHLQPGRS